jgi:PmbA protein
MLKSALELAKITSEDPYAGIPEAVASSDRFPATSIFIRGRLLAARPRAHRLRAPRRKAALDADPRIKNSEGGSFDAATGRKVLANSHGFVGEYRRSYCSVAAVPIAQIERRHAARLLVFGGAQPGESSTQRSRLEKERRAAPCGASARAKSRPRMFRSCSIPWSRIHARTHFRRREWRLRLSRSLVPGRQARTRRSRATTSPSSTTAPCPAASAPRPFDGEGIPTRRTVVIENGILKSYLLNTYTAKKLGLDDHRQRLARTRRNARHRSGQLLPRAGNEDAAADHRRHQRRPVM